MEALREFLKGWFGKILLVLFLAPLALLGIDSYFTSRSNPDVLVSVNDVQITQQQFNQSYQPAREKQLEKLGGNAALLNEAELKQLVLDNLIDKSVLEQQSQKLGLFLTDAHLSELVKNDASFQVNGKFSQSQFEAVLKSNGIDKTNLFARMRNQMALTQLVQLVAGTGFVTQTAQEKLLKLYSEERQAWIQRVDASDFSDQIQVTDKQIKDYFNANKAKLKTKRMADVNYISLDKKALTVPEATTEEIKAAYKLKMDTPQAKKDAENGIPLPTLEELTPELAANINGTKREDQYQGLIKKMNEAALDGANLADIASENKVTMLTTKNFTDDVINNAILQGHGELNHPDVKKQIFDEYNLEEQKPSLGISVNDNTTIWVQPSNFRPTRDKTLAEATQEIKATLAKQQALAKAKIKADKLVATVNAAKTVTVLNDDAAFEALGKINRQAPMLNEKEVRGVFSTQMIADKLAAKAVETETGYSIVAVKQIPKAEKTPVPQEFKQQLSGMLTQIAGDESLKDYIRYVKAQYKIEKNEKAIEALLAGKPQDAA